MVIDYLENAKKYYHQYPLFETAFDFLRRGSLEDFMDGRHDIKGDDLFALVSRNGNSAIHEPKLEVHRRYIDIHFVYKGTEQIGWKFLDSCVYAVGHFNLLDDYQFFLDKDFYSFKLKVNHFFIAYPNDAHAPLIKTEDLFKVVMKIKI
jgi:YhcH/YjgK/YiaL family protein